MDPVRIYLTGEEKDRFWPRVNIVLDPFACWEWTGRRDRRGYGMFDVSPTRVEHASRTAWRLTFGELPDDMQACHHCDNPPCCRPEHLFIGTRSDNMQDMLRKRRHPMIRLTPDQVAAIRERYDGMRGSQAILAREFGISVTHVGYIIQRKSWTQTS